MPAGAPWVNDLRTRLERSRSAAANSRSHFQLPPPRSCVTCSCTRSSCGGWSDMGTDSTDHTMHSSLPVPSSVGFVVPVYRGEAEAEACLLSVLAARNHTAHEVVVVDDASPEPAIREWLRGLAAERRITLLVHEANRGFVASVNQA